VFGVLRVTKAFLPLLGAQKNHPSLPGRILNISSVAGKLAGPYFASYTGTKHALEGISHAMRLEFIRYGIKVIVINPAFVQTAIFDKDSPDRFQGSDYYDSLVKTWTRFLAEGKNGMPLEECSQQIGDIYEASKPKRRYVIAKNRFLYWTLPMLMPQGAMDYAYKKMM
jgi:NAD(P)-dependent dehydrogenase (short-subunit alcohol dehydrogenase family)